MVLQFALRWRTEDEVVSGAGETTCGNTRCGLHSPRNIDPADGPPPPLSTLELPFAYEEKGESKFALVKVVLCARCCKKLMWKRNKDKERQKAAADAAAAGGMEEREADVEVSVTAKYKDDEGRERVEVSWATTGPELVVRHGGEESSRLTGDELDKEEEDVDDKECDDSGFPRESHGRAG